MKALDSIWEIQVQFTHMSMGHLMRSKLAILAIFLGALLILTPPKTVVGADGYVAAVSIDGPIDSLSARHLSRSIDKASADGAELLVVQLDTPGGLLSSTRDMVDAIMRSEIPVAVYVSPPGARAASAGTFITAAANFAVMAPGTNIGAASPVGSGGEDIPSTLSRKINEDTAAFIRSIAEARSRNAQALEETVTKARSYSVGEALRLGIVDMEAKDMADLLSQLDGRTAQTASGTAVLGTKDAEVRAIKTTLLENFLGVISNPNVAFVLLAIGAIGIMVEVLTPGLIGPGVIGAICLALAFLGFGNLPVNWIGVGLILFSAVLFYLEMQEAGLGIFGFGGVISLVVGALLLFGRTFSTPDIPEPSLGVNPWLIGVIAGTLSAFLILFIRFARQETGSSTGYISASEAALEGQWGEALSDLSPTGTIWVANEERLAMTDPGEVIRKGEEVRVIGLYGDVLKVTRYDDEPPTEDNT